MTTGVRRMKGPDGRFCKVHGESLHPTAEYDVWHSMLQRCLNPHSRIYTNYGGRGIKVCKRWRNFNNFLADMGRRPSHHHSIDRINNDGNYEPGNCRWATRSEQQHNKRLPKTMSTNTSGVPGVSYYRRTNKWEAYYHENGTKRRLGYFMTVEDATEARKQWEGTRS